ncbi:hypothetical protein PT974_11894 [Cladobotryum mycophilum]|uniref:Secreted protein n=1 Tax=Cladobotryum mycophilum TaxID=491253 RepID=A0ABR0S6I4_9HYPO
MACFRSLFPATYSWSTWVWAARYSRTTSQSFRTQSQSMDEGRRIAHDVNRAVLPTFQVTCPSFEKLTRFEKGSTFERAESSDGTSPPAWNLPG